MIYRIHDLIELRVNPDVNERVIAAIEFQVGYFKVNNVTAENTCPIVVTIAALDQMKCNSHDPICEAERNAYLHAGSSFTLAEKGLSIGRTACGFDIHVADNGSMPINMILQLLLVNQGVSMVHAAAVANKRGGIILLPSFAEAGKTSLLGTLIRKGGYRILGDDVVMVSQDGVCFCYPRNLVLQGYHKDVFPELFEKLELSKKRTAAARELKRLLKENMPFRGILKGRMPKSKVRNLLAVPDNLATVPLRQAFGKESIADKGNIERIFFLQRYGGSEIRIGDMDERDLNMRLFSIMHLEWLESSLLVPLVGAGFGVIDLAGYFGNMSHVLEKAVRGKRRQIVWIPSTIRPDKLATFMLDEMEKE